MAKSIFKREEENILNVQERYLVKQDIEDDDATFVLLQKLETDEAQLNEQKGNLSSLLNQLQLKVRSPSILLSFLHHLCSVQKKQSVDNSL